MDNLAQYLDFANHHASATPSDIKKVCEAVLTHGFHAAFVNPCYIELVKKELAGKAKTGTALSFPLGQDSSGTKKGAANEAVVLGADELDVVPNHGLYLAGDTQGFLKEMTDVVDSSRMVGKPVIVKFILETGYFDNLQNGKEKLQEAAKLVVQSGADFVKFCSGMGPRNPTLEDLKIIKEAVGDSIKIKVAGGIDTREEAEAFLAAGAHRIGTSHAVEIIAKTNE